MITKLKENNNKHGLFRPCDTVIVAVSGGPDSVALLHALHFLREEWEITVVAAHVNHKLRGEDSEEDERYVQQLCETLSIPLHRGVVNVTQYMERIGVGLQVAARELRYGYLMSVAQSYSSASIVTAHHINDQSETLISRLLRGTSTSGLGGIPIVRHEGDVRIIRPFLPTITRDEIERYIKVNDLHPRLDKSNASRKYLRNVIRLDIMPLLRGLNPKIDEHLTQLALTAAADNELLDSLANEKLKVCALRNDKDRIEVDRLGFKAVDVALQRRMIKLILKHLTISDEISFIHIEHIRMLIQESGSSSSYQLTQHFRVYNDYDRTIFSLANGKDYVPFHYPILIPGITVIPERNKQLRAFITSRPSETAKLNKFTAVFEYDELTSNNKWIVRSRLPGDKIKVDGLPGTKKVKDIFIDDKVSRELRDAYPIIVHNDQIVWIPGLRRSGLSKMTESSDQFLYMIWEDCPNVETI